MTVPLRIGYIDGRSKWVNERAINDQQVKYLGEFCELVPISPLSVMKLMGGQLSRWKDRAPQSVVETGEALRQLCEHRKIGCWYLNLPWVIPYLVLARNAANLQVSFLVITYAVGSEFWLKQWIAIAPFLQDRDVVVCLTESCRQALVGISPVYRKVVRLPIGIDTEAFRSAAEEARLPKAADSGPSVLSIGRIQDIKNIHLLLDCAHAMRKSVPQLQVTVAGEYTGYGTEQISTYRGIVEERIKRHKLEGVVHFTGPVEGEAKHRLFANADLLMNLSTDPGETFGVNLLEAKAFGVPVVCTAWDGFVELVRHGKDGLMADVGWSGSLPEPDIGQAADYAARILRDRLFRDKLSAQAFVSAAEYDYRTVAPKIISAVRDRLELPAQGTPDPGAAASRPLTGFAELDAGLLRRFGYENQTALSLLDSEHVQSYEEWMPKVKSLIGHFAKKMDGTDGKFSLV